MAVYPEWVRKHRTKGTNIKKVGGSYYLYRRTSKRVPGKKNPQTHDVFIGVITRDGVVRGGRKKIPTEGIEVFEYGFSWALAELCPESWKRQIGDEWPHVLNEIIRADSPRSYLLRGSEGKETEKNMKLAKISLEEKMGIGLEELYPLKDIYLIVSGKEELMSKVYDNQRRLLERLNLTIGGECG